MFDFLYKKNIYIFFYFILFDNLLKLKNINYNFSN